MTPHLVTVVGGGVSGCAAALAAARHGASVTLIEQRPERPSPLHESDLLSELVGSPDLGVIAPERASGLLKAELRVLNPLALECADEARTGEESLTVDRVQFARLLTERLEADERIQVVREEVRELPAGVAVIATGPTTWSPLSRALHDAAGEPLRFAYAGRAPMIAAAGTDLSGAVRAPLYPGADPSWFVPLTEDEADELARCIAEGARHDPPDFGPETLLADGTEPVERLASDLANFAKRALGGPRGPGTRISGPALRLVADDRTGSAFHLPEFITALTPEVQREALAAIAALTNVEVLRPGLIHRLPWLPAAALLPTLQLRRTERVLIAGTLAGVIGYPEALATGTVAGINAARLAAGEEAGLPPTECLTGALCEAIAHAPFADGRLLQANFGMLPEHREEQGSPKEERRARQIARALEAVGSLGGEMRGDDS